MIRWSRVESGGAERRASLIERLTTPRRVFLALAIIICVAFGAQMREVVQREGNFYKGGAVPVGSDFNAFFSAGRIIFRGDGENLYDLQRQQVEQIRTLQNETFDGFQPFAYPAFVAVPYALLARLEFLWAYLIHSVFMISAACAAVLLLRTVSPAVRDRPVLVTLAVLASQPLLAINFGGQTVAFSLLCFAGGYASLRQGQDVRAGLWLGLLLYKPQLALPMLLLLLWRRQWRVVGTAGAVGLALSALGVAVAGLTWPREFMDLAGGDFYAIEAHENGPNMISLLGMAEQVFGPKSEVAYLIAGAIGAGVVALLLLAWRSARPEGSQFPLQFGLAMAVTLMVNPHAMFYEASLLIVPIIFLIDSWRCEERYAPGNSSRMFYSVAVLARELIPGLSDGSRLKPTVAQDRLVLSPGGTSVTEPGVSTPGNAAPPKVLTPNQRLFLICLFGLGYLWPLGPLLGIHFFAVLPLVIAVLTWRELGPHVRLELSPGRWRLPVGVTWGESPNAPSGKRS
jgi:hypothetical protein